MSMQLFDKNGNLDKLASLIKKMTAADIKVKLAIEQPESGEQTPAKSEAQMRDEILSDPAVKMVLSTLNASITKIDFDNKQE